MPGRHVTDQQTRLFMTLSRFFRRNEEVIQRSFNLGVFIFIVSGTVHALQKGSNPDITTW